MADLRADLSEEAARIASFLRSSSLSSSRRASASRSDGPAAESTALRLTALGARIVMASDPHYPPGLADLADAPGAIFVRGDLPSAGAAVAIVGSRAATPYGRRVARELAHDLAGLGVSIVSGLARGIDSEAHRGALDAGGATVAVLPGGLDAVTPRHHRDLADEVAGAGALVTEVASGEPAFRGMFVERNRLIAALAEVVVVVEAAERSGALSTAAAARRIGRRVLAVPGDVDRETSRGCHGLLRTGATLCTCAADVLAILAPRRDRSRGAEPAVLDLVGPPRPEGPGAPAGPRGPAGPRLPAERVLSALGAEPRDVGGLAEAAHVAVEEALAILLKLEWASIAARHPGPRWTRA